MKDIRGLEIKAGQMVHVWWPGGSDEEHDILCTVVRTRGRGIKFISDNGKEFTTDQISQIPNVSIAIQGGAQQEEEEKKRASSKVVTLEELDMINKLRDLGWYGNLYKKTSNLSTFRIDMPELQ